MLRRQAFCRQTVGGEEAAGTSLWLRGPQRTSGDGFSCGACRPSSDARPIPSLVEGRCWENRVCRGTTAWDPCCRPCRSVYVLRWTFLAADELDGLTGRGPLRYINALQPCDEGRCRSQSKNLRHSFTLLL